MSLADFISQGITILDAVNNNTGLISDFVKSNVKEHQWSPEVDILEDNNVITVYVNIPGVNPETINIDFFNNSIEIKGERKKPFSSKTIINKNEIIYGHFLRKVLLPISVTSRDSVTINSENGILIINIDKSREKLNRFSIRISKPREDTSINLDGVFKNID